MINFYCLIIFFSACGSLLFDQNIFSQNNFNNDQCLICHEVLDGKFKKPADLFKNDIHHLKGVTCADCHGGISTEEDQDKAMDSSAGFIGVPKGRYINNVCGKCHKKEANAFLKSFHGSDTKGKQPIIVNCIVCHGIHNIVPVKNKNSAVNGANIVNKCSGCHNNASFMKKFNPKIRSDQLKNYKLSKHGKNVFKGDSKSPTCATCHGNHDIKRVDDPESLVYHKNIPNTCNKCHGDSLYMKNYNIPTNQLEEFKKSVHGIALYEKEVSNAPNCTNCHDNHGAVVPEVTSVSRICGKCHEKNHEYFEGSPHKNAFLKENKNDCVVCHGNHGINKPGDEMLGAGDKSVCIKCHLPDDKGYVAAVKMKLMIDSLMKIVETANQSLFRAEQLGMDVSEGKFEWNEINEILMLARTETHTANTDKFINTINSGFRLIERADKISENAENDFHERKYWLALSIFSSLIVVTGVVLKIRKLNRKFI